MTMYAVQPVLPGCETLPMVPGLRVEPVDKRLAKEVIVREHYLHRNPPCSFAYGLFEEDELVGVVIFGTPPSRHLQQSACHSNPALVVELNRLWVHDRMERNTETWFISRALRLMPPRIVVSYADTKYGHYGYVYRAANFLYAGYTDMERKTPRYDYIPWSGGHTRDAFRNGYSKRVRRLPKARYWTVTGDRRQRRDLLVIATWPVMDWHLVPCPGEGTFTAEEGVA